MSQDDGRKDTRRRAKDTPPAPTAAPPSLDELPTGQPMPKSVVAREEAAPVKERQVLDSAALLAELNSLDPEELGRLMSAGAPKRYRSGDRISGEVVRIQGFTAFLDIGAKSEAALGTESMEAQPAIGDIIEAFVVRVDDWGISIAQKLGGADADMDTMEEALESGAPIEGHVTSHNAGGFTVRIGSVSAFCPRSHIDRIVPEELDGYVDQTYTFKVIDIEGSKVVISRRVLLDEALEESAAALWDTLAPGDSVEGIIANVRDFGIFVDLGGIQGL
ncbi:MAG: small subunit ribosomal protein S1, partial [Myxococcota bacterium]